MLKKGSSLKSPWIYAGIFLQITTAIPFGEVLKKNGLLKEGLAPTKAANTATLLCRDTWQAYAVTFLFGIPLCPPPTYGVFFDRIGTFLDSSRIPGGPAF